jgi:rRNA maturation RNase YbeY
LNVTRNTQGRLPFCPLPSAKFLTKIVRFVLSSEKSKLTGDVNIIFVDNPHIRRLNRSFLKEHDVTDVIAFGYENGADVFISVPVACSNARRFKETPRRELIRLVIHGLLHVLGYDDHNPAKKKVMWNKQEALVARLSPQ